MSKNQNQKKVLEKIYNILQYSLNGLKEIAELFIYIIDFDCIGFIR
jgi:hypothetical protein